jgi:phosphoribosylglycinamide formyltransferase-1
MKKLVILISGRGSNMLALLDANLPGQVTAVVSDRAGAAGLEHAERSGVAALAVDYRQFPVRSDFDAALMAQIDRHEPDLVVLAGFMRVLGDAFVQHYEGRLLNIHPSLLPSFPGLHTHRQALLAGVRIHGCTVHFVTPALDSGPIVVQAAVPVRDGDTEDTLAARVLVQEHRIYPQAVRWFLEDKLKLGGDGRVMVDEMVNQDAALIVPCLDEALSAAASASGT